MELITAINRADAVLEKYRTTDPAIMTAMCLLYAKNVLNWEPNGPQQIYWIDRFLHIKLGKLKSVPRGGKTMSVEVVDIYEMINNSNEDLNIYAPKLEQCKETLKYHYDWIDKSKILKAFLRRRNGKPVFSTESYEFVNGSNAKCRSIAGELEGHNTSISRVEEFDDWPWTRFVNDIVRRLGAKSKNQGGKRVRITGTIMGEENFFNLEHDPILHALYEDLSIHPEWGIIDVHLLLQFGNVLDADAVEVMRAMMTDDEWARSMLLKYTEAKNFIKEKYIRAILKRTMMWMMPAVPVVNGGIYVRKPGEIVSIGLDCAAAGTKKESSVYSLQINSQIIVNGQRYRRWLNGFTWEPSIDADRLETEILEILKFFRPDGGFGDALKYDIIQSLNRKAFKLGLTHKDPDEFPENTPGNWEQWWIQPMYNHDKQKHEMYTTMQHGIDHGYHYYPYFDNKDESHEAVQLRMLLRQMKSIRATKTGGHYPSYASESAKIGDDCTDAQGMCCRWMALNSGDYLDLSRFKRHGEREWR